MCFGICENQTDELCKLAVQRNGCALGFVKNQTDEICKLAVQQDGYALGFVKNLTDEICKLQHKRTTTLQFVKNKLMKYANRLYNM